MMARLNTVLPVAVGEALEEMDDKNEEGANIRVKEQAECRSFLEDRPYCKYNMLSADSIF